MCQLCEKATAADEPKQTFDAAGDAGVRPVELEVHIVRLNADEPADLEPGEVVIDSSIDVSHQSPNHLQELVSMITQLNNCTHPSEHTTGLLAEAARVNVISSKLQYLGSADEVQEQLDEQKDALAKLIVTATALFMTALKGGDYSREVTDEEATEELLSWTGNVTADLISDKVEVAISNTLTNLGLNPRNPL